MADQAHPNLRLVRLARGETVAMVSRATGLSRHTISRIEGRGDLTRYPHASTVKALADHYGIAVLDLYTEDAA